MRRFRKHAPGGFSTGSWFLNQRVCPFARRGAEERESQNRRGAPDSTPFMPS